MPPFGCFTLLRRLSQFLQFASSSLRQATLSAYAASLRLRSFLTHFVQPQHVHRLPSFCSPAGRIGLRLDLFCIAAATLWRSIRKALCSALRAVIVFAEKKAKTYASPSLLQSCKPPCQALPCSPLAPLAVRLAMLVCCPLRCAPQSAASRLAQGCFSLRSGAD